MWIELPWPENPANTYARHTETLDSCSGLIRSSVLEIEHGILCWWDLIRSKQLSSVSVCRAEVFARFSGHSNSIHNKGGDCVKDLKIFHARINKKLSKLSRRPAADSARNQPYFPFQENLGVPYYRKVYAEIFRFPNNSVTHKQSRVHTHIHTQLFIFKRK